jgi:hypothetical protein
LSGISVADPAGLVDNMISRTNSQILGFSSLQGDLSVALTLSRTADLMDVRLEQAWAMEMNTNANVTTEAATMESFFVILDFCRQAST